MTLFVVCVKLVPAPGSLKVDRKRGTLVREGVPSVLNAADKSAARVAMRLRDQVGGRVVAASMGPPQAESALREVLAAGADEAVLLSDPAFAGADTLATSEVLSAAVARLVRDSGAGENYLVLCGARSSDGETGQVGPQVAEALGVGQITMARDVELRGDLLKAERDAGDSVEVLETRLPAVVTIVEEACERRYLAIDRIVEAHEVKKVSVWGLADLGLDALKVGVLGSKTKVVEVFSMHEAGERRAERLSGSLDEVAGRVASELLRFARGGTCE
ncbi:MAG: electron transfer flavoprotein subunit beta/FixA family protein [Promethearchaeota archaeon]